MDTSLVGLIASPTPFHCLPEKAWIPMQIVYFLQNDSREKAAQALLWVVSHPFYLFVFPLGSEVSLLLLKIQHHCLGGKDISPHNSFQSLLSALYYTLAQ